jgi:hypothetical protein
MPVKERVHEPGSSEIHFPDQQAGTRVVYLESVANYTEPTVSVEQNHHTPLTWCLILAFS